MANLPQPLHSPNDPIDSLSIAIYGTISSTTTTTPGSWYSIHYPGSIAGASSLGGAVTPAEDFNVLKDRINELQEKLTNKTHIDVSKNQEERICELESAVATHIDVSKNQEERICELESAVAELMEENKNIKIWFTHREQAFKYPPVYGSL